MSGPVIVALVVGGVLLLLFLLARAVYRWNVARIRGLETLALSRGWTYEPRSKESFAARWPGPPFDRGTVRGASNVIHAKIGDRPAVAFEHSFVERSFGEDDYHSYVVCAVALAAPVPPVVVTSKRGFKPRGAGDRILTGHEEFDHEFRVYAPDAATAQAVLTGGAMDLLLREDRALYLRTHGDTLLAWKVAHTTAEVLDRMLALVAAIAGTIPVNAPD